MQHSKSFRHEIYHRLLHFKPQPKMNHRSHRTALHKKIPVCSCVHIPLHQRQCIVFDLDASDEIRMHTASGVHITRLILCNHRSVRMPGDQHAISFSCPCIQLLLRALFHYVILRCAGRVKYSYLFEWLPDIPDQETANWPKCRIQQRSLMPMGKVKFCPGIRIFQNKP